MSIIRHLSHGRWYIEKKGPTMNDSTEAWQHDPALPEQRRIRQLEERVKELEAQSGSRIGAWLSRWESPETKEMTQAEWEARNEAGWP